MSLLTAFVFEPFMVNQPLLDSLLLEPDSFEFFVAWSDDPNGTGTVGDPFRVSTAAAFDSLMQSFPPYTTVHLGPGEFLTNGHADGISGGWQPKRGQRIVGSGIDVTTLKLVPGASANKLYAAIGADDTALLDEFEVSDMTIDCDLDSQAAAVAAGAIKVYGSHIRLRRIRVINFGTRTTAQPGLALATAGAFPENPEPFDCVVEDCVVDQPFPNSVRESTGIVLASGERAADGQAGFHRGCVVRNCVIDSSAVGSQVAIDKIEITNAVSRTAQVTQKQLVLPGARVTLSGALENSQPSTHFNGSFEVHTNPAPTTLQFSFTYPGTDTAAEPTGDMLRDRPPTHRVAIASLSATAAQGGWDVILTTQAPHYRLPGQNVVLNNVLSGGNPHPTLNQSFDVTQVLSPTQLKFWTPDDPGSPGVSQAYIGVAFYGISAGAGIGAIIEGNRVLHATAGVYQNTGNARDIIIRDNHFHDVLTGVHYRLGQVSAGNANQQPTRGGISLTKDGTVATFTTVATHGLSLGQAVAVAGATPSQYNGVFALASIPNPTAFTYIMSSEPASNATGSFAFGALWQVGRLVVEHNVIELVLPIVPGLDPPAGVRLERTASSPAAPESPYVFRDVVIRGNLVRHVNNVSDPAENPESLALQLVNCDRLIVEENVIKLDRASPIEFRDCGAVKFFNDQAPSGKLIQGYDATQARFVNELETDVDLGAVLAT
jgi:hypothetical protein